MAINNGAWRHGVKSVEENEEISRRAAATSAIDILSAHIARLCGRKSINEKKYQYAALQP